MRAIAMKTERRRVARAAFAGFVLCSTGLFASPVCAEPVEDFYRAHPIAWNLATTPGGSWDVYLRVTAKFFGRHVPGHPSIVVQYMPGAGGLRALDYMYNVAPKDGSAIATPLPTSLLTAALEPEKANFDPRKFVWIGSMAPIQDVITVWSSVPVNTIEDAKHRETLVGVTGAGSNTYFDIAMANNLLGTKFKPVQGYNGSVEINLAMERGEVEGRANTWEGWAAAKPDWLAKHLIRQLVQIGLRPLPEIGDAPLFSDLVSGADDKALAKFLAAGVGLGRVVYTPPQVPADRAEALRAAFDQTMTDPDFVAETKRLNIDASGWTTGRALDDVVQQTFGASPGLIQRAKDALTLK